MAVLQFTYYQVSYECPAIYSAGAYPYISLCLDSKIDR